MTVMYKATMTWNGFPGAPGYTNLYATTTDPLSTGAQAFYDGINTWRLTIKTLCTSLVTLSILPTIETIDDSDGSLLDIITVGSPVADVTGTNSGSTTGATGLVVNWLTAGAVFGRRRMGRTFLVPMAAAALDPDGSPSSAVLASHRTAASTYAAGGAFHPCVWVRPKTGTGAHAGQAVPITGARIPDLSAVLRSRRD